MLLAGTKPLLKSAGGVRVLSDDKEPLCVAIESMNWKQFLVQLVFGPIDRAIGLVAGIAIDLHPGGLMHDT